MKRYTIISTYPEQGSQNIGDNLITKSTINAIRSVKGNDVEFRIVWRAAEWESVEKDIVGSDAIILACLAIRENMATVEYPYLKELIETGIPIGVIAAGTSLEVGAVKTPDVFFNQISNDSEELLSKLCSRALFFTTRGLLTQEFCLRKGLKTTFSGDIAFFDGRFDHLTFEISKPIRRVAISDPHSPRQYLPTFALLVIRLKEMFPQAEISVFLHGINAEIDQYCSKNGVQVNKIYLDKDNGLDQYGSIDLHVGFRVHAHVSALSRRKYSYLLEQDGRGFDYGLTIDRKLSVNCFQRIQINESRANALRLIFGKPVGKNRSVDASAVDSLCSIIRQDSSNDFNKFLGLENQVKQFSNNCLTALRKLP